VFYKIFADPIETSVQDGEGNLSYQNIDKAKSYGFELEARASLGRISDELEDFTVQGNFALIRSRVSMSEEQQMKATSKSRPMAGQSPYVANLSLQYAPAATRMSLNLFYNVFGPRIVEVGTLGIPDVYEQPFHSVDFTASYQLDDHWTLGVSATNLLFQKIVLKQDKFDFSRINKGAVFALRLGFVN
jgi:outer membrane receptor protein involved in Fe transport